MGICPSYYTSLGDRSMKDSAGIPEPLEESSPQASTCKEGAQTPCSHPWPHPLPRDLEGPGPPLPPLCLQRLFPFLAQAFLLASQPGPSAVATRPDHPGWGLACAAGQIVLTGSVLQRGAGRPLAGQRAWRPRIISLAQRMQGQAAALRRRCQQVAPLRAQGPRAPPGSLHGDALGAGQDFFSLCSGTEGTPSLGSRPQIPLPPAPPTPLSAEAEMNRNQNARVSNPPPTPACHLRNLGRI